jgi:hypothetical protein
LATHKIKSLIKGTHQLKSKLEIASLAVAHSLDYGSGADLVSA